MGIISESVKDPFNERAWGCLMGAFVADSCGSYLEFYGGTEDHELIMASEEVLDKCMTMPGGGYHRVAAGQVTDDTELMQCLLWGYVDSNPEDALPRKLDLNLLSTRYGNWYNSDPFDIGNATTEALKAISYMGRTAADAIMAARMRNAGTKSNGSLMRCMPHAIFCANAAKAEKYQEIKDIVSIEANFVHGHGIVHEACFVYIVSLAHLLNNPTDANRGQVAFDLAYKLAKSDMCSTVDTGYGEKVEWWLDEAKSWADAAKAAKAKGESAPFLKKIMVPRRQWNKYTEEF
jgi:ADP-ribosylglycohydrolase